MNYIIDKIEDNIAVLETQDTKEILNINKSLLPKGIKEGMILSKNNDIYIIDTKATAKRRKTILEKFKRLRNNN